MLNAKLIISQIEDVRFALDQLEFWQKDVEQNPDIAELKSFLDEAASKYKSELALLIDYLQLPKDAVIDIDAIEESLLQIVKQEKLIDSMCSNWESDDPMDQACSDPGLQYEEGEKLESMWSDFYTNILGIKNPNDY